jgi:hypothetical protein
MLRFFDKNSEDYRENAIALAKVESHLFSFKPITDRFKHIAYHI